MAERGLISRNNSLFFKEEELWCLLRQLKKTLFVVTRFNDAMYLFHGICGGWNHSWVTAIVKSSMHNTVPQTLAAASSGATSLLGSLVCSRPFLVTHCCWDIVAPVLQLFLCPGHQDSQSYPTAEHQLPRTIPSNPTDACHHSSTLIIVACVRFSHLNSQVTEGEYSTAWGSKQANKPEHLKNLQDKYIQEYFSFHLLKTRNWFLWVINLEAEFVFIWEHILANVRSDKSILFLCFQLFNQ